MSETNGHFDPSAELTPGQRAMRAADAVVRRELGMTDAVLIYGTSHRSVEMALRVKARDSGNKVASDLRLGRSTLAEAMRRVGLVSGRPALKRGRSYTKGDKWAEVIPATRSYIGAWKDRHYTHLNPKDARKRLAIVRELQAGLAAIEADLEPRSRAATLTLRKES